MAALKPDYDTTSAQCLKYTPRLTATSNYQGRRGYTVNRGLAGSSEQTLLDGATRVNSIEQTTRLPRNVQAIYLKPLRRNAEHGVPSCDLQLRSYSVRNLEFFSDFALRAAYYLGLSASGPVALPRITEKWTVPKSNFIYKKSQENFERKTLRRLIQIKDGHPDTIQLWLAFLGKYAYYGIGMKANVWEFNKLDVATSMDVALEELENGTTFQWDSVGSPSSSKTKERAVDLMNGESFRVAASGNSPMINGHK